MLLPLVLALAPPGDGLAPNLSFAAPGHGRRLRADFDPPSMMLVAYEPDFTEAMSAVLKYVSPRARVGVLLQDPDDEPALQQFLEAHPHPNLFVPQGLVDTPWVRDYGPFEVRDPQVGVQWVDAGYGGSHRERDDRVPSELAAELGRNTRLVPEVMEGGALISNGDGFCVSTEEFFQENELPTAESEVMTTVLAELGCTSLVLVPALAYDATRHADMFAQFTSPTDIVVAAYSAMDAPEDSDRMDRAVARISGRARSLGLSLRVHRVPSPPCADGITYFSFVNGVRASRSTFLMPSFAGLDADLEVHALNVLRAAMPQVDIVPVESTPIAMLGGGLHCITLGLGRDFSASGLRAAWDPKLAP